MIPSVSPACHRCGGDTEFLHSTITQRGLTRVAVQCQTCGECQRFFLPARDPEGEAAYLRRCRIRLTRELFRRICAERLTVDGPAAAAELLAMMEVRRDG